MAKPRVDRLLIESALDPELRRRLVESPDEVFPEFDLTEEEKDILRRPDHRLLRLLGAAVVRQQHLPAPSPQDFARDASAPAWPRAPGAHSAIGAPPAADARALPDALVALTVVPCAIRENGKLKGISYAAWVNPLAEGCDPATLPPPPGTALPGEPLAPLRAVIQLSAVQSENAAGNAQVGLWATFRQSSNVLAPPPPEASGDPGSPPFGSRVDSAEVRAAAAAVHGAPAADRYERLVDLVRVLRRGDVR